jgi:hypothetical protein
LAVDRVVWENHLVPLVTRVRGAEIAMMLQVENTSLTKHPVTLHVK